jgi:cell division protein FtsL
MRNKNKNASQNLGDIRESENYNIDSARRKLRKYIPQTRSGKKENVGRTSNASSDTKPRRSVHSNSPSDDFLPYTSAGESPSDNLSRLDNRLTNYENHNTEAHDNLRRELEEKINKAKDANAKEIEKAEKRCKEYTDDKTADSKLLTFVKWAIGIVVPIGIAWFAYSYVKTTNKVQENERGLYRIETKFNYLQQQVVDSISSKKLNK